MVNSLICSYKVDDLIHGAQTIYRQSTQEEVSDTEAALSDFEKEWRALRPYLAHTLHNGYLSAIDAQMDAAKGAIACHDQQTLTITLSKLHGALKNLKSAVKKAHL